MKSNNLRSKPASIPKTRWAAYATAGAATAFAGSNSAEAAIHYSGILDVLFSCESECETGHTFQLDQPGDFFRLTHFVSTSGTADAFSIGGIASAAARGRSRYVARLSFGQRISRGPFVPFGGYLETFYGGSGQWHGGLKCKRALSGVLSLWITLMPTLESR